LLLLLLLLPGFSSSRGDSQALASTHTSVLAQRPPCSLLICVCFWSATDAFSLPGALFVPPWSLTSSSPRSAELLDESRLSRRVFSASACRSAARHPPLPSLQKYTLLPSPLSFCRPFPSLLLPSRAASSFRWSTLSFSLSVRSHPCVRSHAPQLLGWCFKLRALFNILLTLIANLL
jgi:hypothetical protein